MAMRRKILLADDSPTIQRLVTQTFADSNFEVISVSNGDAAVRKFEEIKPSVVLADIYMPGKNGYEVCTYVKKHPSRAATPVILLVGAFDAFDEENGRQVGASASITKPFEPHALVDLVESVISRDERDDLQSEPEPFVSSKRPQIPQPQQQSPLAPPAAPAMALEVAPKPVPAAIPPGSAAADEFDLLVLDALFPADAGLQSRGARSGSISEEEIERIADRVIQKLSIQVIEGIAWDVVPDIAEKIVREEMKRRQ